MILLALAAFLFFTYLAVVLSLLWVVNRWLLPPEHEECPYDL